MIMSVTPHSPGVRSVLGVLLGEPAALRAATTDWLEAAAAEVVHRAPDGLGAGGVGGGGSSNGGGGVVSANQLGALLAAAQAARGSEGASGLLDLLAELLQVGEEEGSGQELGMRDDARNCPGRRRGERFAERELL